MADYLAFHPRHISQILDGEKTVTARYGLDRPIRPGDRIKLTTPDDNVFAEADVLFRTRMTARQFVRFDFEAHRSYADVEEFLDALEEYYDAPIRSQTLLDVVGYEVVEAGE